MIVLHFCQWLEKVPLALRIRESTWMFFAIEGSHVLALPLSIGTIVLFDLRLLDCAFRTTAPDQLMRKVIPWSFAGFAVMVGTGVLLFASQAVEAFENPFFRVKMSLLLLLGLNAASFQYLYRRKIPEWTRIGHIPASGRVIAFISLIGWFAVIVCGRTMAYRF